MNLPGNFLNAAQSLFLATRKLSKLERDFSRFMSNFAMSRFLIVEDDSRMLDLLCQGLREAGHTVMPAPDGRAGLELATSFHFDTIVLDIGLPLRDGYEVTRSLRTRKNLTPILMLTARDAEDDIIRGLDLGADDYLVKPFSFPELLARLHALTRVAQRPFPCRMILHPTRLTVMRESVTVQLTRTEFLLLQTLTESSGKPVTRQKLLEAVWGEDRSVHSNTLDVFINALRAKVDAPFHSSLIRTVRGVGYRFQDEQPDQESLEELAG
jgi:DNA-binding response OmpR family regulator